MEIDFVLKIDQTKMDGLAYCEKTINTMKELRMNMPPELMIHCKNTIDRMCELAESLEIGWRKWVTEDFNQSLQKNPLLQKMTCCENDLRNRYSDLD